MGIRVRIVADKLTDGLTVYDVIVGNTILPAISAWDAKMLAGRIIAAIKAHTNEDTQQ